MNILYHLHNLCVSALRLWSDFFAELLRHSRHDSVSSACAQLHACALPPRCALTPALPDPTPWLSRASDDAITLICKMASYKLARSKSVPDDRIFGVRDTLSSNHSHHCPLLKNSQNTSSASGLRNIGRDLLYANLDENLFNKVIIFLPNIIVLFLVSMQDLFRSKEKHQT